MKFKTLSVAVAVSAPLILTASASADFVGITVVLKDIAGFEDVVAKVVNLYAMFSDDDGGTCCRCEDVWTAEITR